VYTTIPPEKFHCSPRKFFPAVDAGKQTADPERRDIYLAGESNMKNGNRIGRLITLIGAMLANAGTVFAVGNSRPTDADYPYQRVGVFASFVADSFHVAGVKAPQAPEETSSRTWAPPYR
jgi:hypothetical protein